MRGGTGLHRAMNVIDASAFGQGRKESAAPERVAFHRTELSVILDIYGRMVAAGEWKDYSIDFLPDRAVFSVFRRATEHPLFRIEKDPKRAQKQGAYAILGADGRVLKRGHDLRIVMRFFTAMLLKAVD